MYKQNKTRITALCNCFEIIKCSKKKNSQLTETKEFEGNVAQNKNIINNGRLTGLAKKKKNGNTTDPKILSEIISFKQKVNKKVYNNRVSNELIKGGRITQHNKSF